MVLVAVIERRDRVLKMQDREMKDFKMGDHIAGVKNARAKRKTELGHFFVVSELFAVQTVDSRAFSTP